MVDAAASCHRIADEIRTARSGIAVRAGVSIADVERQPALNDRALVDLPPAQPPIIFHERQQVRRRDAEVVLAVPAGRTVIEVRIREELVAAVLAFPLQGVLRENRIPAREPLRQLRLQ